ncbi:hypothetical protein PE36_12232 [Moritella sp. PE36]|uniref:type VI secretion system-associated FHA domain protein TagH n=1 Tax=Moritella sp. PE36 TaxID=58051 RepID=UPI0001568C7A|nr:type VI secretion system-associated FHA domain protein TagH [Moritella sp. PE36]EDM66000.1 hypothetical protein PE36_12232 [Moritella sp. PE36]
MGLFLSVISYQQLSPNLQANFTLEGASAVIGRSDANDWVLPDGDKILSSRHAELTLVMDKYYITDVSTNGVFINESTKPLGKGNRHALTTGEQIILGEYVIEVVIESALSDDNQTSAHLDPNQPDPGFSSFTSSAMPQADREISMPSVPNHSLSDPYLEGSEMDDSLVLESNFIPDDWNWDQEGQSPDVQQTPKVPQLDAEKLLLAKTVQSKIVSAKIAPTKTVAVDANNSSDRRRNTDKAIESAPVAAKSNKPTVSNTDNMMALLKGLGIEKSPVDGDEEWWFDLGASMRTINEELMSSLRERAAFKNKFRVNHTMFQIKENNPFKFSASVDDLFRNLYLRSSGSFMSTNKAITEAFGDLRQHEQSMRAGLEGAVVGILDQLAPENMQEEQGEKGFFAKFNRSNKEQKLWRHFIEMHEDIRNEITVNRESILSDAFVRAYENKQKQG